MRHTCIDYFIESATYGVFIHELQDFGKRTSERSKRVSFPKSCNEWIKIGTKHFLRCNLFIAYITRIKQTH